MLSGDGVDTWQGEAIADRLGIASLFDADVTSLSGGEAKRVALASALVHDSDLLVLDEPTNHLDIDAIVWLEEHLAAFRGGLVLITHDRFVLDRVTTRIAEIDQGQLFVYQTGYSGYLEARQLRADQEATDAASRRNLARRELAWLRRGAPRDPPSSGRGSIVRLLIDSTSVTRAERGALDMNLSDVDSATPRLGDLVVELHGVGHRFDSTRSSPASISHSIVGNVSASSARTAVARARRSRSSPVAWSRPKVGWSGGRLCASATTTSVRATSIRRSPCAPALVGEKGEVDWRDRKLMERFWFDDDAAACTDLVAVRR